MILQELNTVYNILIKLTKINIFKVKINKIHIVVV